MDPVSIATYAIASQNALLQQQLQISAMKSAAASQQAAVQLLTEATQTMSTASAPPPAESGRGSVIDITV